MFKKLFLPVVLLLTILDARGLYAQNTEERFHDLFITAGYSTAFGAALGASMLAFTPEPQAQLRYIYMGASLGFIGGSIMGGYLIFSPLLFSSTDTDKREDQQFAQRTPGIQLSVASSDSDAQKQGKPEKKPLVVLSPMIDFTSKKVDGLIASWQLAI